VSVSLVKGLLTKVVMTFLDSNVGILVAFGEVHVPYAHLDYQLKLVGGLPDEFSVVRVDHDGVRQSQMAHHFVHCSVSAPVA